MHKHPFRRAIEAGIPTSAFAKLFAPDAIIHAPMLSKPVQGLEGGRGNIVSHAAKIAAPIQYAAEVKTTAIRHSFSGSGSVAGFRLEAATILVDGEDGLIREVRVVMRSWPMVTLFPRRHAHRRLRVVDSRGILGIGRPKVLCEQPHLHTDRTEAHLISLEMCSFTARCWLSPSRARGWSQKALELAHTAFKARPPVHIHHRDAALVGRAVPTVTPTVTRWKAYGSPRLAIAGRLMISPSI